MTKEKKKQKPGKKRGRVICYYWRDVRTGRRVSWNFPNKKAAEKWRDNETYRYSAYASLEDWLRTKGRSRWEIETSYWKSHRDKYMNYRMYRGIFKEWPDRMYKYEDGYEEWLEAQREAGLTYAGQKRKR